MVNGHISVGVMSQIGLNFLRKLLLWNELFLKSSVDLYHSVFNLLNHILWHLLLIQDNVIVIENTSWLSEVNCICQTTFHRCTWSWNFALGIVWLHVIKSFDVFDEWLVINLAIFRLEFWSVLKNWTVSSWFWNGSILLASDIRWNLYSLVDNSKKFLRFNLIFSFFVLSEQVDGDIFQSFLEEVLQLILHWIVIRVVNNVLFGFRRERGKVVQIHFQIFVLREDQVCELVNVNVDICLILVGHCTLNEALSLVKWESKSNFLALSVQIMGSYITFVISIVLIEDLVQVGSRSISSSESLPGISDFNNAYPVN